MSDWASAADSPSSASAGDAAAVVQFSSATDPMFADALPSDWAFAGQDRLHDGEAIDAVDNEVDRSLPPLIAVATFVAVEAEMFDAVSTPLVAFALPADEADEEVAPEAGIVMWSGEPVADSIEPLASHHGETAVLALDFVSHGVSYDWTDPLFYS